MLFGVDNNSAIQVNIIEFLSFASLGNAVDFGDMTIKREQLGAVNQIKNVEYLVEETTPNSE